MEKARARNADRRESAREMAGVLIEWWKQWQAVRGEQRILEAVLRAAKRDQDRDASLDPELEKRLAELEAELELLASARPGVQIKEWLHEDARNPSHYYEEIRAMGEPAVEARAARLLAGHYNNDILEKQLLDDLHEPRRESDQRLALQAVMAHGSHARVDAVSGVVTGGGWEVPRTDALEVLRQYVSDPEVVTRRREIYGTLTYAAHTAQTSAEKTQALAGLFSAPGATPEMIDTVERLAKDENPIVQAQARKLLRKWQDTSSGESLQVETQ